MKSVKRFLFVLCGLLAFCAEISAQTDDRPRTIITTDGEVDDADSFIRVLLYANDLNIEGIIYSSSQHHWAGDGKGSFLKPLNRSQMSGPDRQPKAEISHRWIGTTWVQDIIADYAKCYANLLLHDKRYPSPEYLNSIVKIGNIEVEGDMAKPTEGSEHIKDIILDSKPGKVHLEAWCVSDFKSANHAPVVQVEGELNRAVKAGSSILLKGMAKDLDGNKVSYHWWQYREAGTSDKVVEIENPDLSSTQITIPEDAEKGSTFHIILQVADNGTPALTRFQRVILQIQ